MNRKVLTWWLALALAGCGGSATKDVPAALDGSADTAGSRPLPDGGPAADAGADRASSADAPPPVDVASAVEAGALAPDLAARAETGGPGPDLAPAPDAATGPIRYTIQVPLTQLPADGSSLLPLLIRGVKADGSAATDDVVLSLSRQKGGLVKPRVFKLGGADPQSYFVPCLGMGNPDCLGTTRVLMELASAPGVTVAESAELTVAALDAVGTPAMCLLGENVMFVDGTGYIFTGTMLVRDGKFDGSSSARSSLHFDVQPTDPKQGRSWDLDFSKRGEDLKVAVYRGAERDPFAGAGRPGLEITTDSRGCNTVRGDFQVHKLSFAGNQLLEALVSFEQFCDGSGPVRGCIHFTSP